MIPYAYPRLDYTPSLPLGSASSEVRTFRVDHVTYFKDGWGTQQLTELAVTNTDEVPAQVTPSVTRGVVMLMGALNHHLHRSRSVAVRLYRPGYEMVEIESWELVNHVVWLPAVDLEAQEAALDSLLPSKRDDSRPRDLPVGSISPEHRAALLFGVAECERLAGIARPEQAERLNAKAAALRDLAGS